MKLSEICRTPDGRPLDVSKRSQRSLAHALAAMAPPPKMNVHEWAEARRVLPPGSPEPGKWRSKPYQKPVLEWIGAPGVKSVVFVGASQGAGKTEILLNAWGYYADADPSPQILVTYSLDMAEKLSKHRVAKMIESTPSLREKVSDPRTRNSNNTILDKMYVGGEGTFAGANSAGGLSMHPKRVLLADEIGRWPASAGTEGDPLKLAETRTTAYWNAVKVYSSSPSIRETCRLWRLWQQSDQHEWSVPCAACEREQVLKWSQVAWAKNADGEPLSHTAHYACEHCGAKWDDAQRWKASERGRYVAQAPFRGTRGARLSGLAVLGRRLSDIVDAWLAAQGNPEELKVFINTVLCEWWDEEHYVKVIDETGLLVRREEIAERAHRPVIPARCAIVTAAVDTQDNRIEVSAWGWGAGEESWWLGHWPMFGDPSQRALWDDLDRWLAVPWRREGGGADFIRATCVDTGGHHTEPAYRFCEPRFRRVTPDGGRAYVFAIRGRAGPGNVWPRKPGKAKNSQVPLYTIQVDPAKEQLYGRLSIAEPGPGYVHIGTFADRALLEGLTSERCVTRTDKKGFPQRVWEKRKAGARNEPLDTAAYSFAALCGLRALGYDLERACDELAARVWWDPGDDVVTEPIASAVAPPVQAPQQPAERNDWLGDRGRNWFR